MEHLTVELVLWILLAFFVGCILGCILRQSLSGRRAGDMAASGHETVEEVADEAVLAEMRALPEAPVAVVEEASELAALDTLAVPGDRSDARPEPLDSLPKAAEPRPEPMSVMVSEPTPLPADTRPKRPQGLAAPRGERADNLQRISGIGPKLEKTLHDLGFFHYDQIAAWTPLEVTWINEHLRFRGRVEREQWIEQARLLAAGEEERFAQVYGTRAPLEAGDAEALHGRRGQGTGKS
jgi:predicted flap endonuclease-1-like 5' DNA nuclease